MGTVSARPKLAVGLALGGLLAWLGASLVLQALDHPDEADDAGAWVRCALTSLPRAPTASEPLRLRVEVTFLADVMSEGGTVEVRAGASVQGSGATMVGGLPRASVLDGGAVITLDQPPALGSVVAVDLVGVRAAAGPLPVDVLLRPAPRTPARAVCSGLQGPLIRP